MMKCLRAPNCTVLAQNKFAQRIVALALITRIPSLLSTTLANSASSKHHNLICRGPQNQHALGMLAYVRTYIFHTQPGNEAT